MKPSNPVPFGRIPAETLFKSAVYLRYHWERIAARGPAIYAVNGIDPNQFWRHNLILLDTLREWKNESI